MDDSNSVRVYTTVGRLPSIDSHYKDNTWLFTVASLPSSAFPNLSKKHRLIVFRSANSPLLYWAIYILHTLEKLPSVTSCHHGGGASIA